jgi:hypothetical protein
LTGKRTEALQKLVRPLVERFQDNTVADSPYDDLSLAAWKPTVGGKSNSLTAAVLEQFCAGCLHPGSIYLRRYIGK